MADNKDLEELVEKELTIRSEEYWRQAEQNARELEQFTSFATIAVVFLCYHIFRLSPQIAKFILGISN